MAKRGINQNIKQNIKKSMGYSKLIFVCLLIGTFSIDSLSALAATDMTKASSLYNSGHYAQAKEAFIELVCQDPTYWPAHYQLANTYLKLNDKSAAEHEYQWCLKFCKNQDIRRRCQNAIAIITNDPTAISISPDDALAAQKLQAKLTKVGQQRVGEEQAQAKAKQAQVLAQGQARAEAIKKSIGSRVEQASLNSDTWYFTGGIERSGFISRSEYDAIIGEAQREAQERIERAKAEAKEIKAPTIDHTTEGLKSQIVAPASHSKIKLAPHGTNIYIRNYKSIAGANKIPSTQ